MRKNQILIRMFILGLFVLPITFLSSPDLICAQEAERAPMELDGTEWDVTMVFLTKKGKKDSRDDKLIFSDKRFISQSFEKKGYNPTNYSLTLQEDGTTRFGTMQVKGKETSFWKGVLKDGTINGSVHTQFSGGSSTKTTYFNGKLAKGELRRKGEKPMPPPPSEPKVEPVVSSELPMKEATKAQTTDESIIETVQDPGR